MATVTAEPLALGLGLTGDLVFSGVSAPAPAVRLDLGLDGTVTLDTDAADDWQVTLVDGDGAMVAEIPPAAVQGLRRAPMDVESATISLPLDSPAGQAVAAEATSPDLEVLIRRGGRVKLWGPIVQPDIDLLGGTVTAEVRGALHHVDRTLTGPPSLTNDATNPDFARGLTGWSQLYTTLVPFGEDQIPTFGDPTGYMRGWPSGISGRPHAPRSGAHLAEFQGQLLTDTDAALQLHQDTVVLGPGRATVRAAWWVPSTATIGPADEGEAGRTNLDHVLIVSAHLLTDPLPIYYYLPRFVAVAEWGEDIPRDQWVDREVTLDVPPGWWVIHRSLSPLRVQCWATLAEMTWDPVIPLRTGVLDFVEDVITHAQDSAYSHANRSISVVRGRDDGSTVDQPLHASDHQSCLRLIDQLAQEGRVEWRPRYAAVDSGTSRMIEVGCPPLGARHRAATLTVTDHGSGHVAALRVARQWGSGSTVITAQSSRGQTRAETSASTGSLAWEEVVVAPDWVPRWRLPDFAARRLAETSAPLVLEVELDPGHSRTRPWLTGDVDVLDRVWVHVDRQGVTIDGWHQVRQVTHDPATDAVSAVLVPEVE